MPDRADSLLQQAIAVNDQPAWAHSLDVQALRGALRRRRRRTWLVCLAAALAAAAAVWALWRLWLAGAAGTVP
jgi:type VI protein secretion system component VasF